MIRFDLNVLLTQLRSCARLFLVSASVGLISLGSQMPARASGSPNGLSNQLQEIRSEYLAGAYEPAFTAVSQLLAQNNSNAELHYIKANLWVKANQFPSAVAEYKNALSLSPDPAIKAYCISALQAMNARKLSYNTPANIVQQAQLHANLIQQDNSSRAATLYQDGQQFKADNDAQAALTAWTMSKQHVSRADSDAYQAAQAGRDKAVLDAAQNSGASAYALAQSQTAAMNEASQNLANLLTSGGFSNGPKLSAVGTNLYVRNYSDDQDPSGESAACKAGQFATPLKAVPKLLTFKDSNQKSVPGVLQRSGKAVTSVVGAVIAHQ